MKIDLLIDQVLPEGSVLYKHNHGALDFYKSDDDFDKGEPFVSQKTNENCIQFFERVVQALIKEEQESKDPEPLVSIDYAIWSNH